MRFWSVGSIAVDHEVLLFVEVHLVVVEAGEIDLNLVGALPPEIDFVNMILVATVAEIGMDKGIDLIETTTKMGELIVAQIEIVTKLTIGIGDKIRNELVIVIAIVILIVIVIVIRIGIVVVIVVVIAVVIAVVIVTLSEIEMISDPVIAIRVEILVKKFVEIGTLINEVVIMNWATIVVLAIAIKLKIDLHIDHKMKIDLLIAEHWIVI